MRLWLFVLFVVVPVIELAVIIQVEKRGHALAAHLSLIHI